MIPSELAPVRSPAPQRYYTSHQVGDLLQVNPSSVVKWINDGILHAYRTPGGHRRVAAKELVRFAQQHGMPVPEVLQGLATTKVLVVDDEPRWLRAVQRGAKPLQDSIDLQVADNGIDALLMVGALRPDILILDLRMPGLDGFQVLERLRENPGTRAMAVVVVSGSMSEKDVEHCRALGAVECLAKPVPLAVLLGAIQEVATKRVGARA